MVKYFVKKHCEATELLCMSQGRVQDYYYGKNTNGAPVCKDREPKSFEGTLCGLDSKQEADELLSKMQVLTDKETAAGFWQVSLSVVEA